MQKSSPGERFSAILVNYNGASTLPNAVRSALRQGIHESEIVVVDNGSVDSSTEDLLAAIPHVQILRNSCNAGFARAVNRGMSHAHGEFLLLLNNDAELSPGALQGFADAFDAQPSLAIAGGQLRYPDGRLQSSYAPLPSLVEEIVPLNFLKWWNPGRYRRMGEGGETRNVESVFGACLAVRSGALSQIGLLDEDFFFYFEEVEWCRRAQRRGWAVGYVPDARAVHLLGHTAKRFRSEARVELQRSKLLYFRKCAGRGSYLLLSVFLVFRSGVNAIFGVLGCLLTLGLHRRTRNNTRAYLRILAWHLAGRPAAWGLPDKCC